MIMSFYSGSLLITSLASLALGIFVFLKGKGKLSSITLGLFSASVALWCFGQFMGEMVEAKEPVLFWTRVGMAGAIFIPVFFLHFTLALIDRAVKQRSLGYFVYGLAILFLILDFTPFFVADVGPALGFRYYPKPGPVYPIFAVFLLACFGYALFRLVQAYRNSTGAKKNQLLYVLLACLISLPGGITAFFPVWNIDFPVLSHIALPFYIFITIYAILKHQLLDISIIVHEGLIYSALTLLFAGFYALAVLTTNCLLSNLVPFHPALTVLLVVFISVLIFQPVRDKVQRGVDRLFFRGEYRYQKRIDDLSAENQKLFRSLLQADKMKSLGMVAAGMAHEIKNPLAMISGLTQVLPENLSDPEFISRYSSIVSRQLNRINLIVEDLLKFGRPSKLEIRKTDVNEVLSKVIELVEDQLQKRGIEVSLELGDLPAISADPEQLNQAFMNLILNAIQAMPEGGKLWVRSFVTSPGRIQVVITDTGVGIPKDMIPNIFDPFFTTKEGGTGMGLAITYRIIKEHKGEIEVESQEGQGTTFRVYLGHAYL